METPPYGGGIRGKLRRKPLRKVAKTPYDRPPASVSGIREPDEGSWLGRLVNCVSRFFSSVLPKRLYATPVQGVPIIGGTSLSQSAQVTGAFFRELLGELSENKNNKNMEANNTADKIILEFEQFIKQKSFTRAQCEHLMSILQSRIVDSDTKKSEESGIKNDDVVVPLRATISHQDFIPDDHTVPPVKLVREYMRFKVSNASPLHLNLQNHMFHENKQVQSNSNSAKKICLNGQKPPILSHVSTEIPENNYFTPGSVRTSAIYKISGSSYVKGEGSSKDGYVGSLSLESSGINQTVGQVLKRRSSTLYNKFRSTCPIRRVRQKLGLNSSKRIIHSVIPGNVEPCTTTVFKKDFQDNSSPNQRLDCLDGDDESIFKKRSNCDIALALAQSTKMENQILQQLHELAPSPKRKSPKLEDNPLDVTIANGFINSLSHDQEGVGVLEEDASTSSGVKSTNTANDINLVPATATIHGNNAVDAGISNCKAISGNHKPAFLIRESEDNVIDPSSQLKHEDELNISQHKDIPSTRTEGSPLTVLANFPSTSLFSKAYDLKPSLDSFSKYSKGFTFPSMPSSFTSQPSPTPTMPRPLVLKLVTQKECGMTPSFNSTSMGAKRALFSLPTTKDNSHASMLEVGTRLSNNSTSYVAGIFSTIPTLDFGSTSLIISSTLASQPLNEVNETNLEGKPHNESPVNSYSSSHDNTTLFKFGSKSSASAAVSQFPGTVSGSVLAATNLSNSAVGSSASSPPPDSRSPSSLAAKTLSDASNNLNFISSKSNKLDSLYPDYSAHSLSSVNVTGFGGTRATQVESPTSQNSASASLFQLKYGNRVNSGFDMTTSTVPNFGNGSAAVSSLFPTAGGNQSAFSPTLLGASDNKFNFSSTKFDNLASSDLPNGGKTSHATSPGFSGTLSTQVEIGSSDILASQVQSTSGHRADSCAVSAAPSNSSFAITSLASSLFLHASGSQPAVAPTTISGLSNNLFSFISKPRDTDSLILDNSQQSFPGVFVTGFGQTPPTQVQSVTSLISSSLTSQFQSFIPFSTMGMDLSSSSSLGSSFFGTTVSNPFISSSSFPTDVGFSSPNTAAAATTYPLATISHLFGLNSKPPTLPTSGLFVSSASSQNSGFPFATPFIFNSSSNLATSFSSAAGTSSVFSRHPTFSLQKSAAGVSTTGDNEMSIEETGDNNQSADSMFQQLGQPGNSPAGPVFGGPAVQPASPVFKFAGQQNLPPPVPPQLQPSGSVEFPQGGSFAFGSGGGGVDKSSRRIIRIRKDKMRKKIA